MRILTYTLTLLVCLAGSRLAAEGNDLEILEQDNKEAPFEKPAKGAERPFFMGFSNIPPAISIDGIAAYVKFLDKHSDIVCLNFDGGVPWVEALKGKDFSMSLMDDWKGNRDVVPKGNTILLSLTPLDFSHVKLAKYYGEKKDLELPPQWSNKTLDNADVKKAYLNYVKAAVKFFNPKYVSIGQNVNEALTASPAAWRDYKDLHKHIYAELKKEHPKLRVFATVSLSHLSGLYGADKGLQKREVAELLKSCDLLGLSVFPYGPGYPSKNKAEALDDDFFAPAAALGKPIGIVECGVPSRKFKGLGGEYDFGDVYQKSFIDFVLKTAQKRKFEFVVNKVAIDIDKLLELCPQDFRDFIVLFAYTGLAKADGSPKKSLSVWDAYFKLHVSSAGQ